MAAIDLTVVTPYPGCVYPRYPSNFSSPSNCDIVFADTSPLAASLRVVCTTWAAVLLAATLFDVHLSIKSSLVNSIRSGKRKSTWCREWCARRSYRFRSQHCLILLLCVNIFRSIDLRGSSGLLNVIFELALDQIGVILALSVASLYMLSVVGASPGQRYSTHTSCLNQEGYMYVVLSFVVPVLLMAMLPLDGLPLPLGVRFYAARYIFIGLYLIAIVFFAAANTLPVWWKLVFPRKVHPISHTPFNHVSFLPPVERPYLCASTRNPVPDSSNSSSLASVPKGHIIVPVDSVELPRSALTRTVYSTEIAAGTQDASTYEVSSLRPSRPYPMSHATSKLFESPTTWRRAPLRRWDNIEVAHKVALSLVSPVMSDYFMVQSVRGALRRHNNAVIRMCIFSFLLNCVGLASGLVMIVVGALASLETRAGSLSVLARNSLGLWASSNVIMTMWFVPLGFCVMNTEIRNWRRLTCRCLSTATWCRQLRRSITKKCKLTWVSRLNNARASCATLIHGNNAVIRKYDGLTTETADYHVAYPLASSEGAGHFQSPYTNASASYVVRSGIQVTDRLSTIDEVDEEEVQESIESLQME